MKNQKPLSFDEDIFALEQAVMNQHHLQPEWAMVLALEQIKHSPILLNEYAKQQYRSGRLLQAEKAWTDAVKTSAGLSLNRLFQASLAALIILRLKLGDMSEAESGLRFLAEECERDIHNVCGEVFWALASGARLLGKNNLKNDYYNKAVAKFAHDGEHLSMLRAMLDQLLDWERQDNGQVYREWFMLAERAERFIPPTSLGLVRLVKLLLDPAGILPQECFSELKAWANSGLEYPYDVLTECLLMQAQLNNSPVDKLEMLAREMTVLQRKHKRDLELSFVILLIKHRMLGLAKDPAASALAYRELEAVCALTRREASPALAQEVKTESEAPDGHIRFRVQCFHALKWIREGTELPQFRWKRKKARELMVFLLLQPAYGAMKEQIIETLFEHCSPIQAVNQLNVVMHHLKRLLSEQLGLKNAIATENGYIRLREEWIEFVDVEQYLALIRVADQLWTKDRGLAVELYDKAAVLYGTLVPEIMYVEWLEAWRSPLREKQSRLLYRLSEEARRSGEYDKAETCALEWIELCPQQEEAYQTLLKTLIEAGRKGEAKLWYRKLEEMCTDEFGTKPLKESVELYQEACT